MWWLGLALVTAGLTPAQSSDQEAVRVFIRVRDRLRMETVSMPRYTCVQTITRKYFRTEVEQTTLRGCDAILGARRTRKYDLAVGSEDRLRLDVAVASSREIHSWAGANHFEDKELGDIVGWGPSGTGDFRGFIQSVFGDAAQISFDGELNEGGKRLLRYRYAVAFEDSRYAIHNYSVRVFTAFDGSFVLDPERLDLARLTVTTAELPEETEMCQVESEIDYQRMSIGAAQILVPRRTVLRMIMRDTSETENVTSYGNCREYSSSSVVRFEGEDVPVPAAPARRSKLPPPPLPPGLDFQCRIKTPIDEKAAAGDAVEGVLTSPIQDRLGVALALIGSPVRGRIVRLTHHYGANERFELRIRLESIVIDGVETPFAAAAAKVIGGGLTGRLRARAQTFSGSVEPQVGTFVFPGKRLKLAFLDSNWVTAAPAPLKPDTNDRDGASGRTSN